MNCGDGPEFSPKGDWVLFSCEGEGGSHLYLVHPNGTVLERLTNAPHAPSNPTMGITWARASLRTYTYYVPVFALLFVPVLTYIAIVRYHLYDIDAVINRTLVYGALSACVVGIYVLAVVAFGALFQAQGNLAVSLFATALVAVLFQPLRSRLQRGVNGLMYGERDDPYAVISRLGKRLEAALRRRPSPLPRRDEGPPLDSAGHRGGR